MTEPLEEQEQKRNNMTLDNAIIGMNNQVESIEKELMRLKIAKNRQDFLMQLRDCVKAIGGRTDWITLETPLGELCDSLAHNGLTFTTRKIG